MLQSMSLFLGLASVISLTMAYPTGMPKDACKDMKPNHGAQPQTSESPFMIEIRKGEINKDQAPILYAIRAKTGNATFKGFTIYSDQGGNHVPNLFSYKPKEIQRLCQEGENFFAGTHFNSSPKAEVEGVWWGPNVTDLNSSDPIYFKAVVVVEKTKYWTDIQVELPMTAEYKAKIETHIKEMKSKPPVKSEEEKKEEELKETIRKEKERREKEKKEKEMEEKEKTETKVKSKSTGEASRVMTISIALLSMSIFGSILFQTELAF